MQILFYLFVFSFTLVSGSELKYNIENDLQLQSLPKDLLWPWSTDDDSSKTTEQSFNLTNVLSLEDILNKKIFGQEHAIRTTVNSLICYRAGISDPAHPIAVLLYAGPTGVGKTELAKELSRELKVPMIQLNMSEYSTEQALERLIGVPFGYRDSEQGGLLSNAILANPYSVVLIDEIEKSHPFAKNLFLHIFDEGFFSSATGLHVDCHNCIFIATCNIAAKTILLMQPLFDYDEIAMTIEPELMDFLTPELYNRMELALFLGLKPEVIPQIVGLKLQQLAQRIQQLKKITVEFDKSIVDYLIKNGYSEKLGARPLKRLIKEKIVVAIAKALIEGKFKQGDKMKVCCDSENILIKKM